MKRNGTYYFTWRPAAFYIALLCIFIAPLHAFSQQGCLYGTTYAGGKYNYGTLFRYNISAGTDTILMNFDSTYTGAYPLSNVILASDGLIFGNTYEGGVYGYGTIFSYNPVTGKDSVWKNFDSTNDGAFPIGALMQAKNGLIYGTTPQGIKRFGTLFSLNISTGQYKVVYAFDSVHGSFPWDAPAEGPGGLLYGTTNSGGSYNDGVIFCINPLTGKDSTCFNFDDSLHGQNPDGSLCLATDSVFYGMTNSGGAIGYGVLFGYKPATGQCNTLVNFNDTNGAYAFSNVIQATDGLIYGMTEGGGTVDGGALFSYDPVSGKDSVCVKFVNSTGANSFAGPVQAGNGLLYGVTAYGGTKDEGVIFSYNTVNQTYIKLIDFDASIGTGAYPNGSLLFVKDTLTSVKPITIKAPLIKTYPIPANDKIYIQTTGQVNCIGIYDMEGRMVFEEKLQNTSIKHHFCINTAKLSNGFYQLKAIGNGIASCKIEVIH